jgi:hypothetical protein
MGSWAGAIGGALAEGGAEAYGRYKDKKKQRPSTGASSGSPSTGSGQAWEGFKRGGKVRKTGVYKLHRGERVLTAKQEKKRTRKRARGGGR